MEPRIDWNRLTFQSSVTDQMLFGNNVLRGQYLKRGGQVRDFFDTTRKLGLGLEWMERYHSLAGIQAQLLSWMVHICLQQFRVDVLCGMQKDILAEYLEEALAGDQPFCWEYLTKITGSNLHLMSGNRCVRTPSQLSSFLFDFNDERKQLQWGRQTISEAVSTSKNRVKSETWETDGSKILSSTLAESVQVSLDSPISQR